MVDTPLSRLLWRDVYSSFEHVRPLMHAVGLIVCIAPDLHPTRAYSLRFSFMYTSAFDRQANT